jgi:hypothetical protein
MRGAGGCGAAATGGAVGRGATGGAAEVAAIGVDAVMEGGAVGGGGASTAAGAIGRGAVIGGTAGVAGAAGLSAIGGIAGRAVGVAGGGVTGAGGTATGFAIGGTTTGFATAGGTTGRGGITGATASFRCVIALRTSPGREMCERSILVLISSSPRDGRTAFPACDGASDEPRRWTRTFSASKSSRELECVFFSVTPTVCSTSRMALLLTSSSLARSLIRTLLIRPFVPRVVLMSSSHPHGVSFSEIARSSPCFACVMIILLFPEQRRHAAPALSFLP